MVEITFERTASWGKTVLIKVVVMRLRIGGFFKWLWFGNTGGFMNKMEEISWDLVQRYKVDLESVGIWSR